MLSVVSDSDRDDSEVELGERCGVSNGLGFWLSLGVAEAEESTVVVRRTAASAGKAVVDIIWCVF